MQHSLGLIEVTGLSLAITVADVMAKTASVRLLGVERTIGSGWMLVKIHGDVASVHTALSAGEEMARRCSGFVACTTIARPAIGTSEIISASRHQDKGVKADVACNIATAETPVTALTKVIEVPDSGASAPAGTIINGETPETVSAETLETDGDAASVPAGAIIVEDNPGAAAVETVLASSAERPESTKKAKDRLSDTPAPAGKEGFTNTLTRTVSTVPAFAGILPATCKICGDPLCGRHKGEPRSKCIHYQKTVLR